MCYKRIEIRYGLLVFNESTHKFVLLKRKHAYTKSSVVFGVEDRKDEDEGDDEKEEIDNDTFLEQYQIPRGRKDMGESNFMCAIREFIEETRCVPIHWIAWDPKGFLLEWEDKSYIWRYRIYFIATKKLVSLHGPHFFLIMNHQNNNYNANNNHNLEYGISYSMLPSSKRQRHVKKNAFNSEQVINFINRIKLNYNHVKETNSIYVGECNNWFSYDGKNTKVYDREFEHHSVYHLTLEEYIGVLHEQLKHYASNNNYNRFINYVRRQLKCRRSLNRSSIWLQRDQKRYFQLIRSTAEIKSTSLSATSCIQKLSNNVNA